MTKKLIVDSIKAGILIGIGCITYVLIPNHILGATLFSLGLLTVCVKQLQLYTGKIGNIGQIWAHGWPCLKNNYKEDIITLVPMLAFNLMGIFAICWLFGQFSGLDFSFVNSMIEAKSQQTWIETLIRAIGCGAMMEIAVSGYKKTENYLAVIMPVMVFILCGFEHCIADFGYMALAGVYIPWFITVAIIGNSLGSWIISKFNF